MRGVVVLAPVVLCWGCSGSPEETTEETTSPKGACGDVFEIDVDIIGTVIDDAGQPVDGVDVVLEERNWAVGTVHGTARTDALGEFVMAASRLPVVEGCWGTVVQFWLVGDKPPLGGEKPMNTLIVGAYNDGSLDVDLGAFPLILRE